MYPNIECYWKVSRNVENGCRARGDQVLDDTEWLAMSSKYWKEVFLELFSICCRHINSTTVARFFLSAARAKLFKLSAKGERLGCTFLAFPSFISYRTRAEAEVDSYIPGGDRNP
ncbi:Metabotropic glutamate receptor 2 [Temnothorax longispinosus]|uniref:Metabotropic glutamate receptor 2 n=1 Tax=Temnothorax longispinosus TaxID=300112 RepID=A0A4S2KI35_9HYME|nr:Metabotropic glutamate receptor 2 [Temnothorax longispinosus]